MAEPSERDTALLEWYGRLPVRRVDLVGDYAGNELFLIEGDSILLRCFEDPQLDFDAGFQMLHAVYEVEYLLQNLVQRKCNFNIVFFDLHQELCIPRGSSRANRSKFLLARSLIRRHLEVNLANCHPSIKIHSFTSVQDPRFQDYLSVTGVYFFMSHDGANPTSPSSDPTIPDTSEAERELLEHQESSRKIAFRITICYLINKGYNVALINGMEWMDTKVMTQVVEGSRTRNFPLDVAEAEPTEPSNENSDNVYSSLDNELSGLSLESITSEGEQKCSCISPEIMRYHRLTERECLTIATLAKMLTEEPEVKDFATTFLVHTALLGQIPLGHRRQDEVRSEDSEDSHSLQSHLIHLADISNAIVQAKHWAPAMESNKISCDISDFLDGRLLSAISHDHQVTGTPELSAVYGQLAHVLCSVSGVHLSIPTAQTHIKVSSEDVNGVHSSTILPFSNPVFDKHLASIHVSVAPLAPSERQTGRIFQEVTHWHSAKRRLDTKSVQLSVKDKKRAMRRNDFFMAEMQSYAASLTNASGKSLEPETITLSGKTSNKPENDKENQASIGSKSNNQGTKQTPKGKGVTKKQAMLSTIATTKAAKDNEIVEKVFSTWHTVRKNLDSERSQRAKYIKMKAYLRDLPETKRMIVQAEVEFHLLCILVDMYRSLRKEAGMTKIPRKTEMFGVAALLWDTARKLAMTDGLTKTIANSLRSILEALKLPDIEVPLGLKDRKLTCDPELFLPKGEELGVDVQDQAFQLLHCGPYMDRNLDSAPDSRVPFEPDGWQKKVLDELDADKSVFVVAPTSAGKTFISFYAMEKVLRANDDGILVYVAPTKALVNQIAAEIQARFTKTYKYPGKSVWAIHTRDYRINNPSGCQVLVTVPHILQIMLLAPSNAKTWSPRVKYIIFDEIHSIGQAEDGVVWEQLLLLAPCPIIALSATVGNPEMFNAWLASTQRSSGHQLTMIQHKHRFSDLRKFVFNPPKKFAFRGLAERPSFATLGLDDIDDFSFVHPVASLVNKSRGMPDDLSLEARDCWLLFESMLRHQTNEYPVEPSLHPANGALPKTIKKADIIGWEKVLKDLLRAWLSDDKSPFEAVMKDLEKSMSAFRASEVSVSKGEAAEAKSEDLTDIDSDSLYATTLPLLCKLHERDALPAIFFNYDRNKCEQICKSVMQELVDAETLWKETSPLWKARLGGFEQYKHDQSKVAAKKPAKPSSKKKTKVDDDDDPASKTERLQEAAGDETNPYANFDPDAPVDGFHFAAKHKAEASELASSFYQMKRRGLASWLTDALKRGIGVHHAGMNRKYRQVVEMLFRKGYLRVVIATGTLALGINMPCATVVFSGDSIFLTALNFRQAAGRAGRRGFDLLGNVVFQGISHGKICRLLSSRLPDLNGHFPVTTTLVLRLFSLLHESDGSSYATKAINSLLSQPRLYLDGPAFKDQVLHHLRFSIEYLRRQDLLSSQGAPINFAGLTSHLYFTENSSFALNALIKEGYFHELCIDITTKESNVLRTLMLVLAHLFGRYPCREADQEYIENIVKRSPSIVFLPPLPPQAAKILRKHNQDTLKVFTTYVRTFVDQHVSTADSQLPLTGLDAGGTNHDIVLPGSLLPTKIRSAFVALSGHDDTFQSISDLCHTSRSGVFLEEAVIPHLDVYPEDTKTPLNAYLYDFFMHGDIDALEKANGVRKAEVWFVLNDFSLVLATIMTSLANFLKLPESDLNLLDVIGEGDETNNAEDDKFTVDSTTDSDATSTSVATTETGKTSISTSVSVSRPKAKKKVKDSWDDNLEEELAESDESTRADEEDPSTEELEKGFLNVFKAISKLRVEFDTKFRKIFA